MPRNRQARVLVFTVLVVIGIFVLLSELGRPNPDDDTIASSDSGSN